MFRKYNFNLSHIIIYIITMVFLFICLPYISIKLFPAIVSPNSNIDQITPPKYINLYLTKEKKYEKIPFEKYVQGVVASEMPDSFHLEALKAQAVASRTYALGRINSGAKICDSTHCQVYRSTNISTKVKAAVKATKGQLMYSKGKLAAHALYFSSSCGKTENSQDVFVSPYSYLVSVSSSYEPGATHKKEVLKLSLKDFSKEIKKAFPQTNFGTIKKSKIRITSLSKGGRVKVITVGKKELSGSDLRYTFNLYSTRFKISFSGKNIIITTSGSGHGVGMSQYGANGLALKGKSYEKILKHYYKGVKIL